MKDTNTGKREREDNAKKTIAKVDVAYPVNFYLKMDYFRHYIIYTGKRQIWDNKKSNLALEDKQFSIL